MLSIVMASDLGHKVLTTRLVFVEKTPEGVALDFHEGRKFIAQVSVLMNGVAGLGARTEQGVRRIMRRFVAHGRLPRTTN